MQSWPYIQLLHFLFVLFFMAEISVLKSIEFPHSTSSNPGEEESKDALNCPTTQTHSKPLEVLLRERNKVLQSENTALKAANSELQGRLPWSRINSFIHSFIHSMKTLRSYKKKGQFKSAKECEKERERDKECPTT